MNETTTEAWERGRAAAAASLAAASEWKVPTKFSRMADNPTAWTHEAPCPHCDYGHY